MADQSQKRQARQEMMLHGSLYKVIPTLAIPMIITQLIDSIYNLADTYFVSQLGITATAAVGVNDSLLHLLRSIAMGFGMGASSYISRLMGAKDDEKANRVASTTLVTSMCFISVVAAIGYLFRDRMVVFLGATPACKQYAIDYASFILFSAPFTAGELCCSQCLRAEGSTTYSMIGMTCGCIINCILDPLFINKLGMGVAGAAIATTISKFISFVVLLSPYLRRKTLLQIRLKYVNPSKDIYREVAKMGIPTFLRMSLMSFSQILKNNIAGGFSDACLAAVSISNKCTKLVGSAIMGFGQGFQPIAGFCWGAKRYNRIKEAFWTTSGIGAVCGILLGLSLFIGAPRLIGVFAEPTEVETIRIATRVIRSQCITLIPHTWVMICNGLFQALGRPTEATILGLSRQLLSLIPCLLILSWLFGVDGFSIAQATADVVSMFIALPMVINLMKKIKDLPDGAEAPFTSAKKQKA